MLPCAAGSNGLMVHEKVLGAEHWQSLNNLSVNIQTDSEQPPNHTRQAPLCATVCVVPGKNKWECCVNDALNITHVTAPTAVTVNYV